MWPWKERCFITNDQDRRTNEERPPAEELKSIKNHKSLTKGNQGFMYNILCSFSIYNFHYNLMTFRNEVFSVQPAWEIVGVVWKQCNSHGHWSAFKIKDKALFASGSSEMGDDKLYGRLKWAMTQWKYYSLGNWALSQRLYNGSKGSLGNWAWTERLYNGSTVHLVIGGMFAFGSVDLGDRDSRQGRCNQ